MSTGRCSRRARPGRHAHPAGERDSRSRQDVRCDVRQAGRRVQRRTEEIIERELSVDPELVPIFEALIQARRDVLARIAVLDSRIREIAGRHASVRLLMTAPGVGPITAMAVVATFDDAARFRRFSSAGAYPKGEIVSPGSASMRRRTRSSAGTWATHSCATGPGRLRENRAAQSQGRTGAEAGGHAARHVAHQHALPRGGDDIGHKAESTLIVSTSECVQPGRAPRISSLPGLRPGPRISLRSIRP